MNAIFKACICAFSICLLWASNAAATSVPALSFEQLTDHSELVVTGEITRTWSDWDSEHKFIWTHYELSVAAAQKGSPSSAVVLSEPGGVVGIQGMSIAGAVTYQTGEKVLVFLQRMPNGYLRTTGWSQGKFELDANGRIHSTAPLGGLEIVTAAGSPKAVTSLRTLNGITVDDLRARIAAHIKSQGGAR